MSGRDEAVMLWNRRQPYLPPEDVETLRKVERFCVSMCYEELAIPLRALLAKLEAK